MGLDITRRDTGYLLGRSLALVEHAHEVARRNAPGQTEWMYMVGVLPRLGWQRLCNAMAALPNGYTKQRVSIALTALALNADALPNQAVDHGEVALGYYHQRSVLISGKLSLDDDAWTGNDLRAWRERGGMTQPQAADIVGVGLRQYKRLEEPDSVIDALVMLRCLEYQAQS